MKLSSSAPAILSVLKSISTLSAPKPTTSNLVMETTPLTIFCVHLVCRRSYQRKLLQPRQFRVLLQSRLWWLLLQLLRTRRYKLFRLCSRRLQAHEILCLSFSLEKDNKDDLLLDQFLENVF